MQRLNRFTAVVTRQGTEETVHVKNTGRLRELLVPGAQVILSRAENENRKTKFDLVAVYAGDELVNVDSQAPNAAATELLPKLFPGCYIFPERKFGASRFDFAFEGEHLRGFVEVKGITLNLDGAAVFPDAPTERGRRHLRELAEAAEQGYEAYILFLVQRKDCRCVRPNYDTDPEFAAALQNAHSRGVGVLAYDCAVTERTMTADAPLTVILNDGRLENGMD